MVRERTGEEMIKRTIYDSSRDVGSMFFLDMLNEAMCIEGVCDSVLKVEIDASLLSMDRDYVYLALHLLRRNHRIWNWTT